MRSERAPSLDDSLRLRRARVVVVAAAEQDDELRVRLERLERTVGELRVARPRMRLSYLSVDECYRLRLQIAAKNAGLDASLVAKW